MPLLIDHFTPDMGNRLSTRYLGINSTGGRLGQPLGFNNFLIKKIEKTGVWILSSKECVTDWNSGPSIQVRWLTSTYNSRSRRWDFLFGLLHILHAYVHI